MLLLLLCWCCFTAAPGPMRCRLHPPKAPFQSRKHKVYGILKIGATHKEHLAARPTSQPSIPLTKGKEKQHALLCPPPSPPHPQYTPPPRPGLPPLTPSHSLTHLLTRLTIAISPVSASVAHSMSATTAGLTRTADAMMRMVTCCYCCCCCLRLLLRPKPSCCVPLCCCETALLLLLLLLYK